MAYPVKNATYHHEPKFLDRMKKAEGGHMTAGSASGEGRLQKIAAQRRADGGQVDPYAEMDNSGDEDTNAAILKSLKPVPMPTVEGVDTGDNMNADTSSNRPKFMRGLTPK